MADLSPNQELARHLAELGWSPRALARRINGAYGAGTISESAPYHWRDRGRVPYPPVSSYAARVLGDALGRPVAVEDLWPDRAPRAIGGREYWSASDWLPPVRDDGAAVAGPWVTGTQLTGIAWQYL